MNSEVPSLRDRRKFWWLGAVICVCAAGLYVIKPGAKPLDPGTTFTARRGPLDVAVLEGGSIESEEPGEIKCQVKGGQGIKILKITPEGYRITEEDVRTNKVLVELDSSEIQKQITQQQITFGSTEASLTDAQQAYDIQLNQNLSDVMAALQKAEFARMDFNKYMGEKAAGEILERLGIRADLIEAALVQTNPPSQGVSVGSPAPTGAPPSAVTNPATAAGDLRSALTARRAVDFSQYAKIEVLGDGEARQKLRELQDAAQVAQKEQQQAQSTLDGTRRLFERNFVTKIEQERDQLAHENCLLKVRKAETALDLFQRYEFPKAAQESLSKYTESLRELERTRKGSISKLAQAEAKLKSAQAKFTLEERQLKELSEQLDKCTIKAPRPGLLVYGTGGEVRSWRDEEQIREGATVREGQTVVTIPDMRKMCVKVKINESYIRRIQKGQKVTLIPDSFPDRTLQGEVSQVGVLPDSEDSWLNPDMKRYRTTITVQGQYEWIRPGMNTKVQILVNHLTNVIHIPLQAVKALEDKKVCYVVVNNTIEQRPVQAGEFNDEFIEVKRGLREGERVCLRPPVDLAGGKTEMGMTNLIPTQEKTKTSGSTPPVPRY